MGKFGGGQEFTQAEKTKLSNLGSLKNASSSADVSASGNNWSTVVTLSGLDASKRYLVWFHCTYKPNTATQHCPWFRVNNISENRFSPFNTDMPVSGVRVVSNVSLVKLEVCPMASTVTGAKVASGAIIRAYEMT